MENETEKKIKKVTKINSTKKTTAKTTTKAAKSSAAEKNFAADKTLVIVESPAKAKTINKYLGKDYVVEASVGHIKDLGKFKLGVDVENNFEPKYITIRGKADIIKHLKNIATKASEILIATYPDREGEAIAWHIAEEIKKVNPNIQRIIFNEITKSSVKKSLTEPRDIDIDVFMSQQARRVMDRIIGFKVSPFLSQALIEKTTATLSAGRVQSVAMRLICEREEEINAFEPIEYWTIGADFISENKDLIKSKLVAFDGKMIKNPEGSGKGENDDATKKVKENLANLHFIKNENDANNLLKKLKEQDYKISEINKKQIKRKPSSPFTTSLLQQDASRKLGFSNKKTMMIAQRLYEGMSIGTDGTIGLITYMRTDSVRLSPEAVESCRNFILDKFGKEYLPESSPVYHSKSTNMQDAHEAIRPTTINYTPEYLKTYLEKDELALYELIYNRFVASQMNPAIIDQTTVNIASQNNSNSNNSAPVFIFRATGSVTVFKGFLAIYDYQIDDEKDGSTRLPQGLAENQKTDLDKLEQNRSATKPPARYNEASLVKTLDELGIGRPSTYAQIVSTLLDREYVFLQSKAFVPTEIGIEVYKVLIDSFPDLFNVDFTAQMEEDLDLVAEGDKTYVGLMNSFYEPFTKSLEKAEAKSKAENKGLKCEVCGGDMVIKVSRRGRFLGCSNYPECTNTKPMPANGGKIDAEKKEPVIAEGINCDICGKPMFIREGKFGKFYGCSDYPNCKGIKPFLTKLKCPKCESGFLIERFSPKTRKKFWGCSSYPDCDFITNNEPIEEECPSCNNNYLEMRYKKVADGYEKYKQCPKCKEKYELEEK
jgi:DNA topoisomerase-1